MRYILKNPYVDAIRFDGSNIDEIKQLLSDVDKCNICNVNGSTMIEYGICLSFAGTVISMQPLTVGCYIVKKEGEVYVREESRFLNDYTLYD